MRKEGFSKSIRVKKESEFKRIIENGTKKKSENLIVFRLQVADIEGQKFGIKIARGIKKAVRRNEIKRVIREVLRKSKEKFDTNESVVVLCKSTAGGVDLHRLKDELENLI
ncbi:MAG: ribonuclease P protein component [candidate division Zixibacteria bacterium]|nr:ribonuclease P protein component [candidate division Zixibacteria bacterium]